MNIENEPGNISFRVGDGTEIMRFTASGQCFIRGEKVDDNQAIYLAIKDFVRGGLELHRRAVNAENDLNLVRQERTLLMLRNSALQDMIVKLTGKDHMTAHCECCPGIDKPHGPHDNT